MPEPEEQPDQVERHVVRETVSVSSTRGSGITIAIIVVIALALVVWLIMQLT